MRQRINVPGAISVTATERKEIDRQRRHRVRVRVITNSE